MPCCYNLCGRCGVGLDFLPFCSLHSVIKVGVCVNKHLGSKGVLRNSTPHWSKYKPWDGAWDSRRILLVFLGHLWWSISHFSDCWDLIPEINNAKEGGFNLAYSFSPLWQEALVEQTGLHYGREEGERLWGWAGVGQRDRGGQRMPVLTDCLPFPHLFSLHSRFMEWHQTHSGKISLS